MDLSEIAIHVKENSRQTVVYHRVATIRSNLIITDMASVQFDEAVAIAQLRFFAGDGAARRYSVGNKEVTADSGAFTNSDIA